MPKVTKATFKSFVRNNRADLHVKVRSSFDGMQDCVTANHGATFAPATPASHPENTLGIQGVWLVGSSRDYFEPFEAEGFRGFKVFNCCGSFVVAVPTEARQ